MRQVWARPKQIGSKDAAESNGTLTGHPCAFQDTINQSRTRNPNLYISGALLQQMDMHDKPASPLILEHYKSDWPATGCSLDGHRRAKNQLLADLEAYMAQAEDILENPAADPDSMTSLIVRIHLSVKEMKELDRRPVSWQDFQGREVLLRENAERMLRQLQKLRSKEFRSSLSSTSTWPRP